MDDTTSKIRKAALAIAVLGALGIGEARAACAFGAGAEPTLQDTFDALLGPGQLSATSDCLADGTPGDAEWTTTVLSSGATVVLQMAGPVGANDFGIYDLSNPANRMSVFQNADAEGDSAIIRLTGGPGAYQISIREDAQTRTLNLTTNSFGFFLAGTGGNIRYSRSSENPGAADHLYAYQGTGATFIDGVSLVETVFRPSDYILAWEDASSGDNDFNDFVVLTRSVTPVPLPPSVAVLLSGLVSLAGFARRKLVTA